MISVIIPLYNKEAIIERTLKSVLSQDYDDYEVVIVDDGSTDYSLQIAKEYQNKYHKLKNIQIVEQKNGGPSKARNTGVKHAKGEWIVFLDADDEFLPGALKHFSTIIENHKDCNFIACPFYNYNANERKIFFSYKESVILNPYKAHFFGKFLPRTGAFVCKRDLLLKYLFNEGIRRFEDLEMLFRLYHDAIIFTDTKPTMIVNSEFAEASHGRKDIKEDFLGHLDFKGKSFWEKMCLYQFYLGERNLYKEQCDNIYKTLRWRYDLLILTNILRLLCH